MRSKNVSLALVLALATSAVCTTACKKSAETERADAGVAQLRSARRTTEPRERVIGEKDDYLATVRREQLDLRARLQREIDQIDRKLAAMKVELRDGGPVIDPRAKNAAQIRQLVDRRARLQEDMTTVERADERGWDELKATIERDLDESRPRGHI